MVSQFTPVQPGWQVTFHCESTDPTDPAPYEVTLAVQGWVFVPDDRGWELDAVIWYAGEPWDAQALADELGATSYRVEPA